MSYLQMPDQKPQTGSYISQLSAYMNESPLASDHPPHNFSVSAAIVPATGGRLRLRASRLAIRSRRSWSSRCFSLLRARRVSSSTFCALIRAYPVPSYRYRSLAHIPSCMLLTCRLLSVLVKHLLSVNVTLLFALEKSNRIFTPQYRPQFSHCIY